MVEIDAKYIPIIGLIALIPGVLFILDRSQTFVYLSLVSVLIIVASVYVMFGGFGEVEETSGDKSNA